MHPRRRRIAMAAAAAGLVVAAVAPAPAGALNDPEYNRQWGLQVIGAKVAWDAGILGQGVDIAVVDTGVHLGHQDLAPNIGAGRDFVSDDDRAQDDQSHGTHVAGIAAGAIDNGGTVGVAPKARIMPVKVLGSDGSGSGDDVAAGIRWAADNGAEVINLSLGEDTQAVFGPSTEEAVRYAWSKGSICVFAAGNDFILSSGFRDEPALVVSSTSRGDRISYFSNGVGSARWGMSAPGGPSGLFQGETESIFSTTWASDARHDTYGYKAGTSMAAPHVA
ncbi:MAG: S8 family serine peptidase, partial [Actinomycetota bacterium]|nr:S8 family serine peptidase [Actinomycetota bacterium]